MLHSDTRNEDIGIKDQGLEKDAHERASDKNDTKVKSPDSDQIKNEESPLPDLHLTLVTKDMKTPLYNNVNIKEYISAHSGNVRCIAVSYDKKFAASGGEDGKIILYSLEPHLAIYKVFHGHSSDITHLTFSRDGFLLSSSLDYAVKIWHVSQDDSLGNFLHDDAVVSCVFNPRDSGFFACATLGKYVFYWDIRENKILRKVNYAYPPTAIVFSPDGSNVVVGCLNGFCFIYSMPDFKYMSQFIAGPRRKKQAANEKITSIHFLNNESFLVATNDSRIRLYSLHYFSVKCKYIGHESKEAQLQVSVSTDNELLMMPSEDTGDIYIWPINHASYFKGSLFNASPKKDRSKTYQCIKLGKKIIVNCSTFTRSSTASQLQCLVGTDSGFVCYLVGE